MSLKGVALKRAYSSDTDDIVRDFYVPVLQESTHYRRLAGFFTSASLAVAARGIVGFIQNGGRMKLLACPRLTREDVDVIRDGADHPEDYLASGLLHELEGIPEGFVLDHVRVLGWMVASGTLDIRLCLPCDDRGRPEDSEAVRRSGIFHQKVGVLTDADGDTISFSGSVNETARGWLGNIEEFKVFRSWEPREEEYQDTDIAKFQRFWQGQSPRVRTLSVPEAVVRRLVELAPDRIDEAAVDRWYSDGRRGSTPVELFDYQKDAVKCWVENDCVGIFEMATGTGKTFAALGCVEHAFDEGRARGAIIASPYQHLSQQWQQEIGKYGLRHGDVVFADSSAPGWKDRVADALVDLALGDTERLIVLTTHATFRSPDFHSVVNGRGDVSGLLLVADEVHGLGAERTRERLVDEYGLRLGLSATPNRWFDTLGTMHLVEYFGGVVYEFPLEKAINTVNPATGMTFLTPYRYVPWLVSLTPEELSEYERKTLAVLRAAGGRPLEESDDPLVERLLFARANIVKNARAKYDALEGVLDEMGRGIKWSVLYCSPQQIDDVVAMLNARDITLHRFTMAEGTTPREEYGGLSERTFILNRFEEGEYQVLVAMKCLDEGVDVPPARLGVLLCSSGNPREYIQRIGRLIRRCEGKSVAVVYDLVVSPSATASLPPEVRSFERDLFRKELRRCRRIAEIAENSAEALAVLDDAMMVSF